MQKIDKDKSRLSRETINKNLFNIEYMGKILSSFTKATGLYTEWIDTEGKSFYKPEGMEICEFCSYVRQQENGRKRCEKSYKKACKEAAKWKTPYFFKCHAGFVMWAVPIIVDEENLGCIVCGQVLLWQADEFFIEEIMETNEDIFKDIDLIQEKIDKLEVISAQKCQSAAELLYLVVNHLIKADRNIFLEAKKKDYWRKQIVNEISKRKRDNSNKAFDYETYLKREKRLLQNIRVANKDKVIAMLPILFTDIDVLCDYDYKSIKRRCVELVSMISRAIVEGGLDAKLSITEINKFHEDIDKFNSSDELFFYLNNFLIEFLDSVFILSTNKQLTLLKDARKFIDDNYYKNISIEDVAKSVFISSSYLSHLFKDNLNCTVNKYITRVRIEKAVELMGKREFTIQEIGKKVGFNNQGYFTKVFKKYMGVTPIVYRSKFI